MALSKKTFLAFFTSLMLVLLVTACGSEDTSSTDGDSSGELAQGVTDNEILVGHLGPQTGPVAVYDYIRKGMESYFKYVNENGGVDGRELKLVAYDDQYQPSRAVQLASRLVEEDEVFAVMGNVCTPCNTAARTTFEQAGIPMIMVSSGAKEFVSPPIENYFGSSILNYRVEARVFLDYAVNELGAENIAVAYQNDDFGKEGLIATQEAIGDYDNAEITVEVPYVAGEADMSSQAQRLSQADPDAILMFAVPNPAATLKRELHRIGVTDVPYLVSSVGANDTNQFELAGEDVWEGTISAATFPMPGVADDEDMQLYVDRYSADHPGEPVEGFAQVGWATAQVMAEAIERTGEDLTWANFKEAMYSFDNWEGSMYEGVTFAPDNHYGLTTLIMTEAKDGEIMPISGAIKFDPATGEITYEDRE